MTAVEEFETKLADFFGSKYAVCVDCCTHGIELSLRLKKAEYITSPHRTYLSIPMLANKLNIDLIWKYELWSEYYEVYPDILDAAVLFRKDSYVPNSLMSISFQFQKHLNLGRGGVILTDSKEDDEMLKKMRHDGRQPDVPWREQDVETLGYHYYMTEETAKLGLEKLPVAIAIKPKKWTVTDWNDLTKMKIFQ